LIKITKRIFSKPEAQKEDWGNINYQIRRKNPIYKTLLIAAATVSNRALDDPNGAPISVDSNIEGGFGVF
jgi:hypothetical protein